MILAICNNPSTLRVFKYVKLVITLIKVLVPIALIVSVMIDYMKEVTNQDKELHNANNLLVKKLIAAVLVFLIPTLVGIIANISGFNPNNFMSCIENATNENIERLQIQYVTKLIEDSKETFNNSQYNIIKSEINKIKDETTRDSLTKKIDKMKDEFERKRADVEYKGGSDNAIINAYIIEAQNIAADDTHGYNNTVNYNLFNPDVDCGTFISYALRHSNPDKFGNLIFEPQSASQLLNYGFVRYDYSRSILQPGDIVVNGTQHTELYIGDNKRVGAHQDEDGIKGDSTGKEIDVRDMYDGWTDIYRYVGN